MLKNVALTMAMTAALGSVLGAQAAQSPASGQDRKADQVFVQQAAIAGMAEVELGKLAQQRASHTKVKQFGQMMVADHTKAGEELKAIATSEGMAMPPALDPMHEATRDKLAKLTGAAFDRAYIDAMVTAHQTVENLMRTESESGAAPRLKAFATKTRPTVQSHLKLALQIQQEISTAAK